ncbi:hypothetical protein [Bradyrhizobium sp. LHD-71]|uniref:hypothetical protein n=1 Tax=Bradyrhizobium sp. LHD-71 TaxID=3072141 RepID=UPI002810011F|nr:hypothetical protein [Bradyrhizobium sp. LHD-71]MDQ8732818.1 hypothetical protein [Bradyrhizobium sp. LHD-71]
MAGADLDAIIRRSAKEQHKSLMDAVKERRGHFLALAAKAKDSGTRDRHKHAAKDAMLHGTAIAKRLRMSAENAADSYARSIRFAAEQRAKNEKPGKANKPEKANKPGKANKKRPK